MNCTIINQNAAAARLCWSSNIEITEDPHVAENTGGTSDHSVAISEIKQFFVQQNDEQTFPKR
jgi:hypothetical protein